MHMRALVCTDEASLVSQTWEGSTEFAGTCVVLLLPAFKFTEELCSSRQIVHLTFLFSFQTGFIPPPQLLPELVST